MCETLFHYPLVANLDTPICSGASLKTDFPFISILQIYAVKGKYLFGGRAYFFLGAKPELFSLIPAGKFHIFAESL